MKRFLGLLLAAALLLTLLPALPASAATDPILDNALEVWGFDGMAPGAITSTDWSWNSAGYFEGEGHTYMKAEVTENGGYADSQAMKITILQDALDPGIRYLCLPASGDPTNVTNWNGAEQLLVYVDASGFGTNQTALLRIRLTDENNNVYGIINGKTCFRLAQDASAWEAAATEANAIPFPAGFKGWLRIPLDDGIWSSAYGGATQEGQTTLDLSRKIGMLWLQVSGVTSNEGLTGTSLLIDAVSITEVSSGIATFRFSSAFGNNMVLQSGKPIDIFGYGKAGQELTVKLIRDRDNAVVERQAVTADSTGRWEFYTEKTVAGSYDTYTVIAEQGEVQQKLTGVLFGELWIAGGQSNMEWTLDKDANVEDIRAKERNPYVRVFQESGWSPSAALREPEGSWKIADTWDNIAKCSAIGYYFAEQLQEALDVPVGLYSTAAGGTPLAAWLSPEILEKYPDYEALLTRRNYVTGNEWGSRYSQYNARIAPLAGIQAAGFIWYQGCNESGAYDDNILELGIPVLYDCWNGLFNHTEDPIAFYCVQLTPYLQNDQRRSETDVAMNRGVLAVNQKTGKALSVPTYDIPLDWEANGNPGENYDPIHPRTKLPVAQRLSAAALGNNYGKAGICSGPVAEAYEMADDGSVTVTYANVGEGLKAAEGSEIKGFLLAKENGPLVEASAEIIAPNKLKITAAGVQSAPAVKVAYAFGPSMRIGNLANSDGFLSLTSYYTTAEEQPVIPVDPDSFERKRVLDFNALSGDLFEAGIVSNDYESTAVGAEALAGKGYEDSVALAYHYNSYDASTYWSNSIVLNLSNINAADTNWDAAGMLWFWIDTAELPGSIGMDLWINGGKPALGTPVYSYDGTTIRQIGSMYDAWDGTGRIPLPERFRNFIGIPLSAFKDLNLASIGTLYFYLECSNAEGGLPLTLLLDEFWVTKLNEAPDVTGEEIVKDPFAKEIWDVDAVKESFDNSSILTHYSDPLEKGNADAVIEDGKGYSGSAGFGYLLEGDFTKEFGDNNLCFGNLSDMGFVTDWTGADLFWFWVDNTDYTEEYLFRLLLNWKGPGINTPYYTWDGSGKLQQAGATVEAYGSAGYGALTIPLNYTGFIAVPLSAFPGLELNDISSIIFYVDITETDANNLPKALWLDEFWITAEGSYPLPDGSPVDTAALTAAITAAEAVDRDKYTDESLAALDEALAAAKAAAAKEDATQEEIDAAAAALNAAIAGLVEKEPAVIENPFDDVKDGDWFLPAVLWAISQKPPITNGKTETTFAPTDTCTRAEVVQFLWNAAGKPEVSADAENPFEDVKEGDWFYNAVMWAVGKKITSGTTATTFEPTKTCTRAEVVQFLRSAAGGEQPSRTDNPFDDVKESDWFYTSVLWAVEKGITAGTTPKTFEPTKTCTRAEVVQFLYKASAV